MATRPDEAKVWRDPVLSLSSARPCGREWHKLPTKIFNFCSIKNNREHNRKRRSEKWKIVTIFPCSLSSSLYQTIFQISSIDCVLINSQWLTKDALLLDYLVCCPIIVYCRLDRVPIWLEKVRWENEGVKTRFFIFDSHFLSRKWLKTLKLGIFGICCAWIFRKWFWK